MIVLHKSTDAWYQMPCAYLRICVSAAKCLVFSIEWVEREMKHIIRLHKIPIYRSIALLEL